MALLILFGFIAGAATAVSPCVLPVLPVALAAGATGGRRRPIGIVAGLTVSFTFATVALVYVIDALGLPDDQVVVRFPAIGGAFGGREDISVQIALALAAWKTDRPVKTVWSREESIVGHHKRHPFVIHAKWGATRDGRIRVSPSSSVKFSISPTQAAISSVSTARAARKAGIRAEARSGVSARLCRICVRSLALAPDGGLWFGSEYDGLAVLHSNVFEVYTTQDGLSHDEIKAILFDADGAAWVATRDGLTSIAPYTRP